MAGWRVELEDEIWGRSSRRNGREECRELSIPRKAPQWSAPQWLGRECLILPWKSGGFALEVTSEQEFRVERGHSRRRESQAEAPA